jgi:hypothetical protein
MFQRGDQKRLAEAAGAGEKVIRPFRRHFVDVLGFIDVDMITGDHVMEIMHVDRKLFHFENSL